MSQRKLIRPDISDKRSTEPRAMTRRKLSPPEQTNAEEFYYLKQMSARTPMVVVLTNDEELRGWIEWYDKAAIKLNRNAGPNLLIPKHNIRYLFKEEDLRRGRRPWPADPGRHPHRRDRTGPGERAGRRRPRRCPGHGPGRPE